MRWVSRFLPAVAVLSVLVVGSLVLVSRAQTGDLSGSSEVNSSTSTTVKVTKDMFLADANQICQTMVDQINSSAEAFQSQVKSAGAVNPANKPMPATNPLFGTTTTLVGSSDQSSASSSTTAAPPPSGSYDIAPVQANPLTIVNQLLNTYMDKLDALVGMQNDVLDRLQNLSEPSGDEGNLQSIWVSMTQAMVAQNQADLILENVVSDYYTAGFFSTQASLNGQAASLPTAEQQLMDAGSFTQDLLELPVLETNLTKAARSVNAALGAYGLNECASAGMSFQTYQSLAAIIPTVADDYLVTYVNQSHAKQAISLAQVLNLLPAPTGIGIGATSATSTTAAG